MDRIQLAARNNAHLYEQICAGHGCRTRVTGGLLLCEDPPPRFFSQAVTLQPDRGMVVADLVTGGFKDSFFDVVPDPDRYELLFQAEWIWREPRHASIRSGLIWNQVDDEHALQIWEDAWANGDAEAKLHPRQFPISLLNCPEIVFHAANQNGVLVGGVLVNHTPPTLGVSNAFFAGITGVRFWEGVTELMDSICPDLPAVGYERGDSLRLALSHGFESLGKLRVWVNRSA